MKPPAALDGNMFRKFAVTSSTKPLSVNPADVFDETPWVTPPPKPAKLPLAPCYFC